jgi:hypothetical protein
MNSPPVDNVYLPGNVAHSPAGAVCFQRIDAYRETAANRMCGDSRLPHHREFASMRGV